MSTTPSSSSASGPLPERAVPSVQVIPLRFTGSGSEYFRIWIVNSLLLVLTLGLYMPWARVRKLRYVYGNTVVQGVPLDFHGDPRKMFRGHAYISVLFMVYLLATNASPVAGLIAALILAALWPWLIHLSLRFRLAHTSWRGLRFAFTGQTRDAYVAFGPSAVVGALVLGSGAFVNPEADAPGLADMVNSAAVLVAVLLAPWLWHRIKTYQQSHLAYGRLVTRFKAPLRSFYGVVLKAGGLMLLGVAPVGLAVFVELGWARGAPAMPSPGEMGSVLVFARLALVVFLVYLLFYVLATSYFRCQMQNLVWTNTGNRSIRFKSRLQLPALAALTAKNTLLLALTLGLYWPFAFIAMTRLRLEAVHLHTRVPLDALLAHNQSPVGETAGDAAGDIFGADLGL